MKESTPSPPRLSLLPAIAMVCAMCLPPNASAGAGWSDYAGVAELVATDKHYYRFRLALKSNPSGCRDDSWFFQNYGTPGADKIFDTLLQAIKSGLRVRVYVTGICNLDGYAEISSAGIVP